VSRRPLGTLVAVLVLAAAIRLDTQSLDPRQQLIGYLNSLATSHLNERAQTIARITTRAAAERRRADVRSRIVTLIGGLAERPSSLGVKPMGTVAGDGFQMEKIAYESLPGFWVTANVYVPTGRPGPFPAIVYAPGHGPGGKTEAWSWGGNFARNGIILLAYDPLGQGERLQYYDPETKASTIGNPTGEHGEANIGPLLIGDTVARYMVNDGMRAVDYLIGRSDVDRTRVGAFGCSGGGAATALLAAVDARVAVAASACYITSFAALLPSPTGVQEAEQSLPGFISSGLDFPDWVEAFAPKPYAIVSTEDDMFPFAGARQTFGEAQRIYGLYDARDRLQWITGPGGHGNLTPIAPSIIAFFVKHLAGRDDPPAFTPLRPERPADMIVTPTGQVATAFAGETMASLNRTRASGVAAQPAVVKGTAGLAQLQTRLKTQIRTLTGAVQRPGTTHTTVTMGQQTQNDGYTVRNISMKSDAGMELNGLIALPARAGRKPAALLMDSQGKDALAKPGGVVERLAQEGVVVMAIEPRPTPPGTESLKSPYLGLFNLLSLRAFLVGRTIVGLRIDDVLRAMDWLTSRSDVQTVTVHGVGPHGIVALHAAVLDRRIERLVMENSLVSYRAIVDQPIHREVSEVVIPGVLRHYDTDDLLLATFPRPVQVISPVDALGAPLTEEAARAAVERIREAERKAGLGSGQRIVAKSQRP
jgi:cephalosporin-C deacetylase-like acetyl esterase